MRTTVKVTLKACGVVGKDNKNEFDSFVTEINATQEEAEQYYAIGKKFNMGLWYDSNYHEHEDNIMEVISTEIL